MAWTEFTNLGSIFLLVQICCDVTAGGNNAGNLFEQKLQMLLSFSFL